YVHPGSRLVIVQLAKDSRQEFPFRKLVHAWMGQPFRYPVSIPGRLLAAAQSGAPADSVRGLYRKLNQQSLARPSDFVITEAGMISVGQTLVSEKGRTAVGIAVLELAAQRSPRSSRAREALAAANARAAR